MSDELSNLRQRIAFLEEACAAKDKLVDELTSKLAEFEVKEGPLNSERWTLDELLVKLNEWKAIASGKTCVSFECLCFGASYLWHQTHRDNFRKIDSKPEALSRWILDSEQGVHKDFATQVLSVLERQHAEIESLKQKVKADQ